jgi:dienelactone hydrolase
MVSVKAGTAVDRVFQDVHLVETMKDALATRFDIPNRGGKIQCEFYRASSDKAVIYIGGVGGGTHGPANIYHSLAESLLSVDISSLLIDCRFNSDLSECISDMQACIDYLDHEYHMGRIGLIGWSFGGAVVVSVAAEDERVKAVVTVASQSFGTDGAGRMQASILLLHGTGDRTLPYGCSEDIAARARGEKKLVLFPGADHGISQYRDEMFDLVREWLIAHL